MSKLALIDRVCPKCKTGTDFHKGAWYCKTCVGAYSKQYHSKRENLDKRNSVVKERLKKRKEEVVKQFGGKCHDCGGVFPSFVYDFHHLDMSEKEHNPSYFIKMNPEKAQEELKKCIMLCSNCHRVRHHGG